MRSKVPTNAVSASAADSDELMHKKVRRLRKASRSTSECLSSVSSSAESSDSEAGPCLPGRGTKVAFSQPRHAVVIEHQGAGKVVHKPDGTVVWEPSPECADVSRGRSNGQPSHPLRDELLHALSRTFMVLSCGSGLLGFMVVMAETRETHKVSVVELAEGISRCVAGSMAGLATGLVLGPLLAVRTVGEVLARPAVLGALLHFGITRMARWRSGVAGLLRKLQSGDMSRVLEALRAIIAAAKRNPRFARELNKLKGVEILLQRLSAALPDCPLLHLLTQALAELCQDPECRDSLVAAGGVPRLVELLRNPNPIVSGHALTALARLTDHALAVEAIREAGGLTRLVELTAAVVPSLAPPSASVTAAAAAPAPQGPSFTASSVIGAPSGGTLSSLMLPVLTTSGGGYDRRAVLLPAVKLLQVLSQDPASKAALGVAGGITALLDVIARSEPRSETQSESIVALHNCLRGCTDNQRLLASLPHASEVLRGALAGFGPCWHSAKGDLHSMLNVLARLQGVQESGGFIVVQSQVASAAAREAVTNGAPVAAGLAAK